MARTRQTFRIEGLSDCEANLKQFSKSLTRGVLLRTLKKEAQPIADDAAAFAPDDPATGGKDLKSSMLVLSVPAKRMESDVEVAVGPSTKTFYGMFQEFGTAHHGPQPFLRTAWDANVMRVIDGIAKTLSGEIDKTVKRIAARTARIAAKLK